MSTVGRNRSWCSEPPLRFAQRARTDTPTGTPTETPTGTPTPAPNSGVEGFEDGDYTQDPTWRVISDEGHVDVVRGGYSGTCGLQMGVTHHERNRLRLPLAEPPAVGTVVGVWIRGNNDALASGSGRLRLATGDTENFAASGFITARSGATARR